MLNQRKKKEVTLKLKRRKLSSRGNRGVSDPKVKEMEAEWKRVRHQDTLYKNKETIQNMLQKRKSMPRSLQSF